MRDRKLIGRVHERQQLLTYLESNQAELIVVYGRRRVGKTFFVSQTLGSNVCFELSGLENARMQDQLLNFYTTLARVYPRAARVRTWLEAFEQLRDYLETVDGTKHIFISCKTICSL